MSSRARRTDLIGHGSATGAQGFPVLGGRILGGLMLHLGEIYDVMLEKRSGNIAYAVMSFGGFLGIGERYHALPWAALKYDTRQGGYVVGLTVDQLKEAPTYAANELPAGAIARLTAA